MAMIIPPLLSEPSTPIGGNTQMKSSENNSCISIFPIFEIRIDD
jgi:hypothetical protein